MWNKGIWNLLGNFVSIKAENDSRLSAQRWERQFRMEFEKNDRLEDELAAVRTQCTMIQARLNEIWKFSYNISNIIK